MQHRGIGAKSTYFAEVELLHFSAGFNVSAGAQYKQHPGGSREPEKLVYSRRNKP